MSLPGHPTGQENPADVDIRVPADGAYVAVLRTLTAGLAARLDFTIEDIEDLRIAVGEACAMVLPEADEVSDMTGSFRLAPGRLVVQIGVDATQPAPPDYDSFAWQVLTTLADATVATQDGRFVVTLVSTSTPLGGS
ncbi:anti-sigma factor [Nocardioides sp. GY 10127]|uniref:anti-sigma factor n=1 Tax=Nocardioides sp. GY 10127 TaxID=2569762 RepID=UPI0010A7559A|nr:anti-sigma factor [Nocardioides sp. GY 10127]TIC84118.1 anti-sigma factor [Nocardioides sp. GY 10127]